MSELATQIEAGGGMDEAVIAKLKYALAGIDSVLCPARTRWLGDKVCPKCRAPKNEVCREELAAIHAFVGDCRALIRAVESDAAAIRGDAK